MLERLSEQYFGANFISEKIRHSESYLEAELKKEGTEILKTYKTPFLIYAKEIPETLKFFEAWKKHAITLPGFQSSGSSMCWITSISYYPANSEKEKFCIAGQDKALEYLKTKECKYLKDQVQDDINRLNYGILGNETYFRYNDFQLYCFIERFNINLYRFKPVNGKRESFRADVYLNAAEIEGFEEITGFYKKRRKKYHAK